MPAVSPTSSGAGRLVEIMNDPFAQRDRNLSYIGYLEAGVS